MPVVGPPRRWIGEFCGCYLFIYYLFIFVVIDRFCGCSMGMAEVGCGSRHCGLWVAQIGGDRRGSRRWILDSAWLDSSSS